MAFRSIDISSFEPVEPASQPAPQMIWAKIADLVIDERYQRPLARGNTEAIRRIARNFRWARFAPIVIAPVEGGKYAVIDGQHRAHAAAICGFDAVPAMVALVAPEEQALAFIEINTQQIAVRLNVVYRAALVAGAPWAVHCRDSVEAAGCKLMCYNKSTNEKKPGEVYAISMVRKLVESGHDWAVTAGLREMMAHAPDATANFDGILLAPWLAAISESRAFAAPGVGARTLERHKPWITLEAATRIAKDDHKPVAIMRRRAFVAQLRETLCN